MISGIISQTPRLITLAETLIILISQKPNSIIILLYIVLWKIYKNYCVKCKYILLNFELLLSMIVGSRDDLQLQVNLVC